MIKFMIITNSYMVLIGLQRLFRLNSFNKHDIPILQMGKVKHRKAESLKSPRQ